MNTTYLLTQIGFVAVTVIYSTMFLASLSQSLEATGFQKERQKKILWGTTFGLIGWAVVTGILSVSGFLREFSSFPPRFVIVLVVPLIVIIWVVRSRTTKEILQHTPAETIIGLQSFRIFVEILLWMLFVVDLAPIQMTFEGRNLDIISGLTAPLIAFLVARKKLSRSLIVVWNVLCLGLLVNIVTTAILSLPTPFRVFMNEPANTIVAEFPIVWLPALLVPMAYSLHFLSLRQLMLPQTKP